MDGVSLTHGPPGARQHLWSFATAFREITGSYTWCLCLCANRANQIAPVPSFVGNDFFCESGNAATGVDNYQTLYRSDPLWDGQGCGSPPCCELSYPPGVTAPWFCKQLHQTTTDDIEARICNDQKLVRVMILKCNLLNSTSVKLCLLINSAAVVKLRKQWRTLLCSFMIAEFASWKLS